MITQVLRPTAFEDLAELCRSTGRKLGQGVEVRQTDDEAEPAAEEAKEPAKS